VKLPVRWIRLVVALMACVAVSACVVRPLGWGHRYSGEQRTERGHERSGGGEGERYERRNRGP